MTTPDPSRDEISHRWPEFLPGAKAAIFTIWTGDPSTSRIAVLRLETGEYRAPVEGASFVRYSSTGHLIYARQGTLEAAPFNLETLEVTGLPVTLDLKMTRAVDLRVKMRLPVGSDSSRRPDASELASKPFPIGSSPASSRQFGSLEDAAKVGEFVWIQRVWRTS